MNIRKTEKPQITQMSADRNTSSVRIGVNLRFNFSLDESTNRIERRLT